MNFTDAFDFVVGQEGGLSLTASDPGNWTGGRPGLGKLKGTKFGISAKEYPTVDIANLDLDQARVFAKNDYWDTFAGDTLPYGVALLMFDTSYNTGLHEAVLCAQRALGLMVDGVLGVATRAALGAITPETLPAFAKAFTARRIAAYTQMPGWGVNGPGWTHRAMATMESAVLA